jgi:hypothetical protein
MASLMDKATIFIMAIKEFIKVTGKMVKNKGLVSLLFKISMAILVSGNRIKKMERAIISIQMDKDIKEAG